MHSGSTSDVATEPLPVAWHVGRQGEVAGGITQVVNSYVHWQFSKFDVKVITSRDGTRGPSAWLLFVKALIRVMTLPNPSRNIVVVHLSQGGSFIREGALLLLARMRGFGAIAHLHGGRFVDFAKRHGTLVGKVLGSATKVFVLNEANREMVERFVPPARVHLVPNAVAAGNVRPKERLIVFGGRVSYLKGVDVLLAAWSQVKARDDWKLEIAGPVVDPAIVEKGGPNVTFHGALSHSTLMALLDRSSIAVLPSRVEVMPMFILEALARDNCVIATRVGGIPGLIDNGRGILVDAENVQQLASALETAMTDHATRDRLAQSGRASFEKHHSATAIYPMVEALWLDVLDHPVPR